jgi:hypothetical protein
MAETIKDILLVLTGADCDDAIDAAFRVARDSSKKIVALQILTSDLYHYGHNDLIATRPSKAQFLLYIREQVLARAIEKAEQLRERALDAGVSLAICPVETEDLISAVMTEAKKGYELIFLPKEKRRLFPLLKKQPVRQLKKKLGGQVIEC